MRSETRWLISILVGVAAMVGMVILVFLVAVALEPPTWVQILLGIGIVAAGTGLTAVVWLSLRDRERRELHVMSEGPSANGNGRNATTAG